MHTNTQKRRIEVLRQHKLTLSTASTWHSASRSTRTSSVCRCTAARCSGVRPELSRASFDAPLVIRNAAVEEWPPSQATCNAVRPTYVRKKWTMHFIIISPLVPSTNANTYLDRCIDVYYSFSSPERIRVFGTVIDDNLDWHIGYFLVQEYFPLVWILTRVKLV